MTLIVTDCGIRPATSAEAEWLQDYIRKSNNNAGQQSVNAARALDQSETSSRGDDGSGEDEDEDSEGHSSSTTSKRNSLVLGDVKGSPPSFHDLSDKTPTVATLLSEAQASARPTVNSFPRLMHLFADTPDSRRVASLLNLLVLNLTMSSFLNTYAHNPPFPSVISRSSHPLRKLLVPTQILRKASPLVRYGDGSRTTLMPSLKASDHSDFGPIRDALENLLVQPRWKSSRSSACSRHCWLDGQGGCDCLRCEVFCPVDTPLFI